MITIIMIVFKDKLILIYKRVRNITIISICLTELKSKVNIYYHILGLFLCLHINIIVQVKSNLILI